MVEINGIADADSLSGGIYDFVAAVVFECQANAEPVMGKRSPMTCVFRFYCV